MTDAQLKNAGIATGKMEHKNISPILKLGAVRVPPANIVSISFPLGGYLKSSKLLPGMQVRNDKYCHYGRPANYTVATRLFNGKSKTLFLSRNLTGKGIKSK